MPSAIAVFCDDIRQEIGGKVSFIGIYQQSLISPAPFPMTLPRLCVSVFYAHYVEDDLEPVKIRAKFAVTNTTLFEAELPVDHLKPKPPLINVTGAKAAALMTRFDLIFSPLAVPQQSTIEIDVIKGKLNLVAGSLELLSSAPE
jgi:hypothetical protein